MGSVQVCQLAFIADPLFSSFSCLGVFFSFGLGARVCSSAVGWAVPSFRNKCYECEHVVKMSKTRINFHIFFSMLFYLLSKYFEYSIVSIVCCLKTMHNLYGNWFIRIHVCSKINTRTIII